LLEVFNSDELGAAVDSVMSEVSLHSAVPHFTMVEGVPGCGKTYEIVEELKKGRKAGLRQLYVAATRGSTAGVIFEVAGIRIDSGESCVYRSDDMEIRTLDSYLLNSDFTADVVYMDETVMAHAGQLLAVAFRSGAGTVRCYGDSQQVTFCSFTDEMVLSYESIVQFCASVEYRWISHRSAPDVCRMWADKYGRGYEPCVCHAKEKEGKSMSLHRIKSAADVPKTKGVRYIVFTQAEKVALHGALGLGVSIGVARSDKNGGLATVHEDQGTTWDRVYVVRLNAIYDRKASPLAPSIFNREAYCLTASTRHVKEFRYYTVCREEDVLTKRLSASVRSAR